MATYRFTLITPDGSREFGADKVSNWDSIAPGLVVNETYKGVYREYTTTFNFIKDIRRQIIRAVDQYGYDVEIFLTIEIGNDNGDQSSFEKLAYQLKADINEIDITELEVSLNFIDSGFVSKVMNREDVNVNLNATESIDGDSLPEMDRLLHDIALHDRKLIFRAKYESDEISQTLDQSNEDMGASKSITMPCEKEYNWPDANGIIPLKISDYSDIDEMPIMALISYAETTYNGKIRIKAKGSFVFAQTSGSTDYEMEYQLSVYNTYSQEKRDETSQIGESIIDFNTGTVSSFSGVNTISYDIDTEVSFSLDKGDSLSFNLILLKRYNPSVWFCDVTVEYNDITITTYSDFPQTEAKAMLPHELFTKILQIYTGQSDPFYSKHFGRPDLGYDEFGDGSLRAIMTGKMIRGFPWGVSNDDNDPRTVINTSFKDAFEALNCIEPLAAVVEYIGNERKIRIEPMNYFRNTEVVADIGELISEPGRQLDPKQLFSDIKIGYESKEYEELNGLFSYNGEFGFSLPFKGAGETLELVSKWRADDLGIELARRKQYSENPTEDYRSDDDHFIVDSAILTGQDNLLSPASLNNDFETIKGTFVPIQAYNLNITPKRNLLRWQTEFYGCVSFKPESKIRFIQGPKNPNLLTKKYGESEVDEDADLTISDLTPGIMVPEMLTIAEAPLNREQWESIKQNRFGLISFVNKGVKLFGFVQSVEWDINKKTANFELIRANY